MPTETNLVIKRVEQSDDNTYRCETITNGHNLVIGRRRLQVETKPEIDESTSSPNSLGVREGETITIRCNARGTPPPEIKWQRYLGSNDATADIGATGNELTIHNITKYASDTFVCLAENRHGEASRPITVTVTFQVKATLYQEEITANTGEDVFMACMVEGNPIIQAYWMDTSSNKIFTNWQFEVEEENSVGGFPLKLLKLTIRRIAFSDREYGDYTCYVAGNHDEDTATVHLMRP